MLRNVKCKKNLFTKKHAFNDGNISARLQEELDLFQDSDDGQYDSFLNGLTQRRRNQAEKLAPPPTVDVVVGQPSNTFKGSILQLYLWPKTFRISFTLKFWTHLHQ
jgi:uncharacterized protein YehS (DUF1456 family)